MARASSSREQGLRGSSQLGGESRSASSSSEEKPDISSTARLGKRFGASAARAGPARRSPQPSRCSAASRERCARGRAPRTRLRPATRSALSARPCSSNSPLVNATSMPGGFVRQRAKTGQPRIQQHESWRIDGHQFHQRATAVLRLDAIAVAAQVVHQQLRDVDFIVEDGFTRGGKAEQDRHRIRCRPRPGYRLCRLARINSRPPARSARAPC